MVFGYTFTIIISMLVNYFVFRRLWTINVLYTFTWVIGAFLNIFGYAGMFGASQTVHIYILSSIISFNLTYWLFAKKRRPRIDISEMNCSVAIQRIKWINIICQIFMLPFLVKAINIILTTSFSNLRNFAFTGSNELASTLESRIIAWIIGPVMFSTIVITIILIILKKSSRLLNSFLVINVLLYTLTLGGKMLIVISVLLFVFAYYLIKNITNSSIAQYRIKRRYYVVFAIVASYVAYLTQLRLLNGLSIIQNFVVYLYGGISYFDVLLTSAKYQVINSIELHGTTTFGFIVNPILYIYQMIFNAPNITSEYQVKLATSVFENISPLYKFNSLPTSLYFFWRDFHSVAGIIFGTVSLCLIYIFAENMFIKHKSIQWFALYLYATLIVLLSTQNYGLFDIRSSANLLFIFIFTSTRAKTGRNIMQTNSMHQEKAIDESYHI
jgi:oligosaccharide repeat unit polymerase